MQGQLLQREQIARKDRVIDYKEEDIHRKDAVIAEHIKEEQKLYHQIIELQKGGQR